MNKNCIPPASQKNGTRPASRANITPPIITHFRSKSFLLLLWGELFDGFPPLFYSFVDAPVLLKPLEMLSFSHLCPFFGVGSRSSGRHFLRQLLPRSVQAVRSQMVVRFFLFDELFWFHPLGIVWQLLFQVQKAALLRHTFFNTLIKHWQTFDSNQRARNQWKYRGRWVLKELMV